MEEVEEEEEEEEEKFCFEGCDFPGLWRGEGTVGRMKWHGRPTMRFVKYWHSVCLPDLPILIYTKWRNESNPKYEYHVEGYRIIGDVRTDMMVVIDSVTVEMAGNYSCQLISVEGNEVRHCNLEVTGESQDFKILLQSRRRMLVCEYSHYVLVRLKS